MYYKQALQLICRSSNNLQAFSVRQCVKQVEKTETLVSHYLWISCLPRNKDVYIKVCIIGCHNLISCTWLQDRKGRWNQLFYTRKRSLTSRGNVMEDSMIIIEIMLIIKHLYGFWDSFFFWDGLIDPNVLHHECFVSLFRVFIHLQKRLETFMCKSFA